MTLHDVTLRIERGELIGIIGGSGSGKTTLLNTMCGLHPPTSGEVVRADGTGVGYVPQDDIIHVALPLERTLRYAAELRHVQNSAKAVEDVLQTLEFCGRSDVLVGSLSGGERKRASIAAELLAGPGLFFLDEPTSGLDPARGTELMRTLRRLCDDGTTVVLTTHNPLDAENCDKVAVLAAGGTLRSLARSRRPGSTSAPTRRWRSTSGSPESATLRRNRHACEAPRPAGHAAAERRGIRPRDARRAVPAGRAEPAPGSPVGAAHPAERRHSHPRQAHRRDARGLAVGGAAHALGRSLGVARLWSGGSSPLGRPLLASYGDTFTRPVLVGWLVLVGFTLAFLAATTAVVIRKTR
jgi:ABC-type Mn2+/Zn2+ transport system ATPase subunit